MTPVTIMLYRLRTYRFTMNILFEHGANRHSLLYQSVEQLTTGTGCSTVEPKRAFIEVVVEMRRLHPTLVSPQQPALEQSSNAVHFGQEIPTDSSVFSDDLVYVAQFGQSSIASPSICLDSAPWLDTLLNGPFQTGSGRIRYTPETNSPGLTFLKLYHDNNQRLPRCSPTPLTWFLSTYVDLVCFDRARETVPPWSYHGTPQLVQQGPGGVIAAQIEHPLQSLCVRAIFLSSQVPDSPKSKPQRQLCILKNWAAYPVSAHFFEEMYQFRQ